MISHLSQFTFYHLSAGLLDAKIRNRVLGPVLVNGPFYFAFNFGAPQQFSLVSSFEQSGYDITLNLFLFWPEYFMYLYSKWYLIMFAEQLVIFYDSITACSRTFLTSFNILKGVFLNKKTPLYFYRIRTSQLQKYRISHRKKHWITHSWNQRKNVSCKCYRNIKLDTCWWSGNICICYDLEIIVGID